MARRYLCAVLALSMAACGAEDLKSERQRQRTNPCPVRTEGSRWVSDSVDYQLAAEYGLADGQDVFDLWGLTTTPGGTVLLFDAGSPQVVELTAGLELRHAFGRSGGGPGEFSISGQKMPHGEWIAANDTAVVTLDLKHFSAFDLEGRFLGYPTLRTPFPLQIQRIGLASGRVMWAKDLIGGRDGSRVLETWAIDQTGSPVRVRADPMPALPSYRGRHLSGVLVGQADPLWAVNDGCVFLSDGSGDWILRAGLSGKQVDTLHLLPREIPALSKEDEARLEEIRRRGAAFGAMYVGPDAKPTARLKWSAMVVDPDGFIWLEPWRPESIRRASFHALIIDPGTGQVDSMGVSVFPTAFLPGGAYVSLEYDPDSGIQIIRQYSLRWNGSGSPR